MKTGQEIYVVPSKNFGNPFETKVKKVGRIYFYVEELRGEYKFRIEDFESNSGYANNSYYTIYHSKKGYEDLQLKRRHESEITRAFDRFYQRKNFTLDQLKEVAKILGLTIK